MRPTSETADVAVLASDADLVSMNVEVDQISDDSESVCPPPSKWSGR